MPTLFIPELGTQLCLAKDWTFHLHYEDRNETLFRYLGIQYQTQGMYAPADAYPYRKGEWTPNPLWNEEGALVTIPAGTRIKIDRIYIRKNAKDFSSITFYLEDKTKPNRGRFGAKYAARFWVKLPECGFEYETTGIVSESGLLTAS